MKSNYFWAKTTSDGRPGISVNDHMLNVGCVARFIADKYPDLLEQYTLTPSLVGALAALHDLGKISPGFQRKCVKWLIENNLDKLAQQWAWDSIMESDHGKVSHMSIQKFLLSKGFDQYTSMYVSDVLGAHHGRLTHPNPRGFRPQKQTSDTASGINWDEIRQLTAEQMWNYFSIRTNNFHCTEKSPALWWLAGLVTVADWIASDENYFSPERNLEMKDVAIRAAAAIDNIGYGRDAYVPNLSFHDLFHDAAKPEYRWIPNEMQEKTVETIRDQGVYVIEAPMGMGKTEAALWAAYQLLVANKATGIFFGLPTQLTSNRMHLRMQEFVKRISPNAKNTRLIHSNSWLTDHIQQLSPTMTTQGHASDDARVGRDWFASSKRALIATFGVGTVDQALLGVVAAKHFFVRHFALAGKVVILDEVHSYDLYTGTLIDKLITMLEGLGCTVIVLSATLTSKRRSKIVAASCGDAANTDISYPLISGRSKGRLLEPAAAQPPKEQKVEVTFVEKEDATEKAISTARAGGAVLWICNTIHAAQQQYMKLRELSQNDFPIGLLHSRFPYWRREELETEWMDRFGKHGKTRCGSILVATQVVEQSVDLDSDMMITELAPTDMLLQRLGRLWRHNRDYRPIAQANLYIINEESNLTELRQLPPAEILDILGPKARVYDPFILLRSLQVWQTRSNVILPTQIRELIESTYEERDDDPDSWKELFDKRFAKDSNERFLAAMNTNYWQIQLHDSEGVQTRLNEIPTVTIVLLRSINNNEAVFLDGTSVQLRTTFHMETAQAIHKNLVRVPAYAFECVKPCPAFEDYIFENHSFGIIKDTKSPMVDIHGLKAKYKLFYTDDLGLELNNP